MNAPLKNALAPTQDLHSRSKKWLETSPSIEEVRKAINSIVERVRAAVLPNDEVSSSTVDTLTEYFVEIGGELTSVASLDDGPAPSTILVVDVMQSSPEPDYSSLCPDTRPTEPLTREQKRQALEGLKSLLRRPEGF